MALHRRITDLFQAGAGSPLSVGTAETHSHRIGREPERSPVQATDPEAFLEVVELRLGEKVKRGTLAYVEVVGPHHEQASEPYLDLEAPGTDYCELFDQIGSVLGPNDLFCWYGGRFIILVDRPSNAPRVLGQVSRAIANREWNSQGVVVHLTPIVGYLDLRLATSTRELWEMLERALQRAQSSLEIEPFRYSKIKETRDHTSRLPNLPKLWRKAPQWLILITQLIISLIVGLGAPFILYAVCDALGADISGPVYIGVVVVLVITATTIWIEGLLALKATTPPAEPGSPYPPATLIIPAYLPNEAATIMETLRAFLKLEYSNTVQIIIAYNCPSPHLPVEDEMKALAVEQAAGGRFLIEPVRVEGSTSKAQNVNAVVGRVRGRFVGIFDADHHPHSDSLERAWRWLSNGWDIVQGRCSIRNGTDSWVTRMVAIEFEQIYAVSHPGRARFHGFGIFGGSNGFWRTAVLHETRMRYSMLTEDIDSSIRAVVAGYKITGDRDLVSEELAPTSMKQLLNQRLRWAQGWFQVSFRRVMPALMSPHVTMRQKLGLIHLLVWRELFPWYSIQVVPIMTYWVWVYGWAYIHWMVPIFLATTIYTFSTGPGQIILAYHFAQKPMRRRVGWFIEYFLVSTFFYSPFKDALSRIAHVKEAMREKAWKVTPRVAPVTSQGRRLVPAASVATALLALVMPATGHSQSLAQRRSPSELIATLLGGEASTINAARVAAREHRNAEAARLFEKAIRDVPRRRSELLREYADALTYANRSAEAVPLYTELLSVTRDDGERRAIGSQRALALTWSGQHGSALRAYNSLLARSPKDADLAIHRARVLVWLGRPDEAVAALDKVSASRWAGGPLGELGNEILVESARSKARAGQKASATVLFNRAIQRDGRLRASLASEVGDQRAGAGRSNAAARSSPNETIAVYRASVAHTEPGSAAFQKAQRSLALALTSGGAPEKALDAWTLYLRYASGDVDALLTRATLLRDLHRDSQARDAFKAAYALDQNNRAARTGLVDTTINLARPAAREDRNTDAEALFEVALKTDPGRRKEFLREYADQLSFNGRAAEAVPLYAEVLDGGMLSIVDRKRAAAGLANAYAWSGRLKDAFAAYSALASAYPDDVGFEWNKQVVAAREAARTDRNGEAVELFAKAIALASGRSGGILREYADQLTFADRSQEAIPLYAQVLSRTDLSATDRLAARKGLALAYEWSGRLDLAKVSYRELLAQRPDDISLQWKLLVVSGREAARADRNNASAEFFARAIKLAPESSTGILKEYADQLSFTDRSETAIAFYRLASKQPGLTAKDQLALNRSLAQAFDWAGRYSDARIAYAALITAYPNDTTLRWNLLVVSAREAAAGDRNKEAAQLLAQAIRLDPSRRMVILKEYADKLAYSDRLKLAIPFYREVLKQKLAPADERDAALSLALALAWDNQLDNALREYQRLAVADANDLEAALGVARMMSWSGRQSDAKSRYRAILSANPGDGEAQRGLAQAEDWDGRHRAAQALLTRRLQDEPDDLEARRLLAQSLVWSGRPDKAVNEIQRALQYQQRPLPRRGPATRKAPERVAMTFKTSGAAAAQSAAANLSLKSVASSK